MLKSQYSNRAWNERSERTVEDDMNLERSKVAIITGASSGIGEATARLLSASGLKVVLAARNNERLKTIVSEIERAGGEALCVRMDVRNRLHLNQLVNETLEHFGRLDVFVNNAGIAPISRFDELRVQDWDEMIDVNLRGTLYGVAAALPVFKKQRNGHFINVISTAGLKIVPTMGVYAATKNAVRTLTEALRQESGPDIRVTGVSPGFVNTQLSDSMTDPTIAEANRKRSKEIGLDAETVARAIYFAIEQPHEVEIGDLVIRPTIQD